MNTNTHEWREGAENKRIIKIEKKIRVHSCSFVAVIPCLDYRIQRILQQRLMWITVPQMLSQTLGVIKAALPPVAGAPTPRLFQVFINAVMGAQPVPLRFMKAQHFKLVFDRPRDVYIKTGKDSVAHRVNAVNRVGIIQRRR